MKKEEKKVYFYGMEITKGMLFNEGEGLSVIESIKKHGINYKILDELLKKEFDGSIMNNNILQVLEKEGMLFDVENGDGDCEQVMIIDNYAAEFLEKYTDETVFYNDDLDLYLWGKSYFNSGWDLVDTGIFYEIEEYDACYNIMPLNYGEEMEKLEEENFQKVRDFFKKYDNIANIEIGKKVDEEIHYLLCINGCIYYGCIEYFHDWHEITDAILYDIGSILDGVEDKESEEILEQIDKMREEVL